MTSSHQRAKSLSLKTAIAAPTTRSKGYPKWKRPYADLPSGLLLILGALSFLLFAWFASIVYKVTPEAVAIGNSLPLNKWGWGGVRVFGLLALLSLPMWLAWTLASRCQALIVERHFK